MNRALRYANLLFALGAVPLLVSNLSRGHWFAAAVNVSTCSLNLFACFYLRRIAHGHRPAPPSAGSGAVGVSGPAAIVNQHTGIPGPAFVADPGYPGAVARIALEAPLLFTTKRHAWRTWRLLSIPAGSMLCSMNAPFIWPAHEPMRAIRCPANNGHEAPALACTCGLYALKRINYFLVPPQPGQFFGEVALWGRVIEHQDGYRAQYTRPTRLILIRHEHPVFLPTLGVLQSVATRYDIPLVVYESVEACAVRELHVLAAAEPAP